MEKILIIGGNAAGLTAASRAKRIDPRLQITVLEKSPHISYSTCGIPYYLAKTVAAGDLLSYTPESFEKERGIKVHNNTRVEKIEPGRKRVTTVRTDTGESAEFSYDRLLLATGVTPRLPDIPGTDLKNVFTVMNLQDAIRVNDALASASTVSIVGASYVGLGTCGMPAHFGKEGPICLRGKRRFSRASIATWRRSSNTNCSDSA